MIYSDGRFLITDNPEDDYKELHDFAQGKLGIPKGKHYNREGRIYYYTKHKEHQKMLSVRVFHITRSDMERYINTGRVYYYPIRIDYRYYTMKDLMIKMYKEIAVYNGLKLPKNRAIKLRWDKKRVYVFIAFLDFSKLHFLIDDYNLDGVAWFTTEDGIRTEMKIPKEVYEKIVENRKPYVFTDTRFVGK
jgi:hypothetical protein